MVNVVLHAVMATAEIVKCASYGCGVCDFRNVTLAEIAEGGLQGLHEMSAVRDCVFQAKEKIWQRTES